MWIGLSIQRKSDDGATRLPYMPESSTPARTTVLKVGARQPPPEAADVGCSDATPPDRQWRRARRPGNAS